MSVLIVAGGTGGHIFPAVAFGQWLQREKKILPIYMCGNRQLELEIYRASGIDPFVLPIEGSPFGVPSVFKKLKRISDLVKSYFQVRKFIKEKSPSECFLFGSYVSFPALLACHFMGIPTIMHEQNAIIGKVARLAGKLGKPIVTSWNDISSVPVRPFEKLNREAALDALKIPEKWHGSKIVGVLGGSLASGTLTKILESAAAALPHILFIVLADKNQNSPRENVLFIGRQWDMNPVFSAINLAVSRGGASTLAELAAYKIPCVAVPWEKSADGHQCANAAAFAALTGNHVWTEKEGGEKLIEMLSNDGGNTENYLAGSHDKAAERLFQALSKEGK